MRFVNSFKSEQLLLDSGRVDGLIFTLPHCRTLFQGKITYGCQLPSTLVIFPLRITIFNTSRIFSLSQ